MVQKGDLVGRPRSAEMLNGDYASKLISLQTLLIYMQNCHCGVVFRTQTVGGHVSRLESEDLRLGGGLCKDVNHVTIATESRRDEDRKHDIFLVSE